VDTNSRTPHPFVLSRGCEGATVAVQAPALGTAVELTAKRVSSGLDLNPVKKHVAKGVLEMLEAVQSLVELLKLFLGDNSGSEWQGFPAAKFGNLQLQSPSEYTVFQSHRECTSCWD
jgi:hypothetical protein